MKTRIGLGTQMLLDRACPGGGWNAGNGVVYGVPMAPHVDTTDLALLALRGEGRHEVIIQSLEWLEGQVQCVPAAWSLAWSILALHAYDRAISHLIERLGTLSCPEELDDAATLSVAALALDCPSQGNPFKVIG